MKVIRRNGRIIEYHLYRGTLIVVERTPNGLRLPIDVVTIDPQFFSGHEEDMTCGVEEPDPWPTVRREDAKASKESKYFLVKEPLIVFICLIIFLLLNYSRICPLQVCLELLLLLTEWDTHSPTYSIHSELMSLC